MQRLALVFLVAIATLRASAAEEKKPFALSPTDRDFIEKTVRPLLFENCQKCHSTQAKKRKGGLLLDSREAALQGGESGPAAVPGDVDKSLLIQAIFLDAGVRSPLCPTYPPFVSVGVHVAALLCPAHLGLMRLNFQRM